MELIATVWYPDSNPVGGDSVFALLLATLFCLLTSKAFFPEQKTRQALDLLAPLCFLFFYLLYESFQHGRFFTDADYFCALYILLAFGFSFSMRITGQYSWWCRIVGICGLSCFGYTIYKEASSIESYLHETKTLTTVLVLFMIVCVVLDILRKYWSISHKTSMKTSDNDSG